MGPIKVATFANLQRVHWDSGDKAADFTQAERELFGVAPNWPETRLATTVIAGLEAAR